jgi:long-chain acyl-CoA synthetase
MREVVMLSPEQAIELLVNPAQIPNKSKDQPAIVQAAGGQERECSYEQLQRLIGAAVAQLKEFAVKPGDRVVLCGENSPELVASIVACWAVNAIAVPVDLRLTVNELANVVKQLDAGAVFGSSNIIPDFEGAFATLVAGRHLLDLKKFAANGINGPSTKIDSSTIDINRPAFIILTSGTTGMPKGAVHTLGSLINNLLELGEMSGINEEMRGVLPLPLSHIFGLEVMYIALMRGTMVVLSEMTPTSFVQCVSKHKPHVLAGVPTLYGALVAAPIDALALSNGKLLLSGGAPLPVSLAEEFEKKFGKRINNGYGSTESKIVALNQDGPIESVGTIVPSAKIEIVNDQGEVLPNGETGEIRISGPMLMEGYLNQPEMTAKVMQGGGYHTGDMGYFKEGRLYISGRSKEMIIVGGFKVFPVEVEDELRKHKLVKEVAVLGQAHSKLGQIVKAIIVVNEGELSDKLGTTGDGHKEARQEAISQLKEYCKDNLRRELRPMEWDLQPASKPLPKTAAGKIDKKKLEAAPVQA